eukprot:4674348-Prymnesium_polylepis.2
MAVGDQQTFSRMMFLKLFNPERYAWLLPLSGEFHFTVHALMAVHILWYACFIKWVVFQLDCTKTIKGLWTSVELYKYYDHFYQMVIGCLAEYVEEVVPAELLHQPEALMRAVSDNPAAVYVIRFLFEFGFPWLALRQGVRSAGLRTADFRAPL